MGQGHVRKKLPDERPAVTHKFEIGGQQGYVTVGLYEDGSPGEMFVTMSKQGSTLGGLMDCFATSVSMSLQYGMPLRDLVDKFSHVGFEPSGFTKNERIGTAKSIPDYLARWLGQKFLGDPTREVEATPEPKPTEEVADGPPCSTCQTMTVRSGACHRCPNCGDTTGCS